MTGRLKQILILTAVIPMIFSCGNNVTEKGKTPLASQLLEKINDLSEVGVMFGHHDATVYGIGWEGDENRSDIKSVCGDYPAVFSFDLGRIELGGDENLDKVPLNRIRDEIIKQHKRGGIISLSWHVDNPVTNGDSWDVKENTVVASVLPGGDKHELFKSWMDKIAVFMNSLQLENGEKIPVIFRPWHEHTGSWFWWGQKLCSAEEYKALWRMTYDFMQEKGVNHLLYAYSPGSEPNNTAEYLERYPGDDIIDMLGFDVYQFDRKEYLDNLEKSLSIVSEIGRAKDMPIAITETGFETIPDSTWWTETLLPVINKYPVSYVLVWRNAREKENHYYAPYPGHLSAPDFIKFYEDPKTLFVSDLKNKKI